MGYIDPIVQRNALRAIKSRHKASGKCRCGRPVAKGRKRCIACIGSGKKWIAKRQNERRKLGLCLVCGRNVDSRFSACEHCRETQKRHLQRLKREVISAYGGKCSCCGESEVAFLTIDHIRSNGASHRREIKTNRIYSWLKKHGFPTSDFQVLCFNCNCGRHVNGGICPHRSARLAERAG